jgi:hypothetical protein
VILVVSLHWRSEQAHELREYRMGISEYIVALARSPFLKRIIEPFNVRFFGIPPARVHVPEDSIPFVLGESYARFWLLEAQGVGTAKEEQSGNLIFTATQFRYGNKSINLPAFIGPHGLSAAKSENGAGFRITLNRPLTPIYWRLGPICMCSI